ncbi:acyl dehydratase [Rhodococcus rhodochrous J38]|nr:acyl dehydratase [Rhodococcus rhodochrous J38]
MISQAFEDIRLGDISTTAWRTITEDYVRDFADLTWDRHPLHLNPSYAQQTRFGGQIAHGALMLSTLLGLVDLHPGYLQCFYGLDQVRFHAPTYFGDRVHAVSEVVDIRPRSDAGTAVVTCKGSLINQDDTLVFSGLFSFLVAGHAQAIEIEEVVR